MNGINSMPIKYSFLSNALVALIVLCSSGAFAQQNTLNYYLDYAIKNSPLIKDFQNQVLSFSLDSQIIRATLRPQVSGNSNNMYAPIIHGYGYDEAITNKAQVMANVAVNKAFLSRRTIATQIADFQIQA